MPVPVKHHKVLFLRGLIIRALGIHTTGENVQNYNGIFEPNSTGDQLLYTFKTEIFICKTIYLITIPMVKKFIRSLFIHSIFMLALFLE